MLVTIEDPVAVSATRSFNSFASEMFTLPNNGANIAPTDARTVQGGISLARQCLLSPESPPCGTLNRRVNIHFELTQTYGCRTT